MKKQKKNYKLFKNYYKNLNKILISDYVKSQGFGAGLMVPILAYYLPVINSLRYIVDDNPKRCNKKYINLEPIVKNSKNLNTNLPTLITSIATKEASRQIFERLTKLGVKNITLPAINS